MTFKDVQKIITADGWYLVRVRGSHYQYKHPTKIGLVSLPYHKGDLPKSTLESVLKQAKLK
ncbi:MAG: type II toxin-antitoxin system HicA family toxin [Ruminococcus sp.]|nr:type II toxin-antitoxin system HicA family toxin [Ruminococcus sp.]